MPTARHHVTTVAVTLPCMGRVAAANEESGGGVG
jgi:hypothetical protein